MTSDGQGGCTTHIQTQNSDVTNLPSNHSVNLKVLSPTSPNDSIMGHAALTPTLNVGAPADTVKSSPGSGSTGNNGNDCTTTANSNCESIDNSSDRIKCVKASYTACIANSASDGNNSSSSSSSAKLDSDDPCQKAAKSAQSQCGSNGTGAMVGRAVSQGGVMLGAANYANPQALCSTQSEQALANIAATEAAAGLCLSAATSCVSACWGPGDTYDPTNSNWDSIVDRYASNKASCSSLKNNATIGAATTGAQLLLVQQQSATCKKYLAAQGGPCSPTDVNAANNPLCGVSYCASHPGSPLAICNGGFAGNCNGAGAGDNPGCPQQYCQFHPTMASCAHVSFTPSPSGTTGTTPTSTIGAGADTGNYAPPTGDLTNGGGFNGYASTGKGSGAGAGNDNPGGGGGGLGGGGGGGGPLGQNGAGAGAGGSGIKSDIEHGLTSGGGGGYGTTSGVPTEGGGGRGGGARNLGEKNNLDLSRFLPGGKDDPANRGLASGDGLHGLGITGANDLSNFEKISKMMRKKQPLLVQSNGK